MFDYNFPEQLNQMRLTLLLLSLVIPTETVILQKIYKKKKELEIYDYKDSQNWSVMADEGRCALYKVSLQIQSLYSGFIMHSIIPYRYRRTDRFSGIKIVNHLFTYWVRDEKSGKIKDVYLVKKTPFSVISGNNSVSCETFSEILSKFRNIAEIIEAYGSFAVGDDVIYTDLSDLNYDIGISVDKGGKINTMC